MFIPTAITNIQNGHGTLSVVVKEGEETKTTLVDQGVRLTTTGPVASVDAIVEFMKARNINDIKEASDTLNSKLGDLVPPLTPAHSKHWFTSVEMPGGTGFYVEFRHPELGFHKVAVYKEDLPKPSDAGILLPQGNHAVERAMLGYSHWVDLHGRKS